MTSPFKKTFGYAVLAVSLAASLPALAQNAPGNPPPPPAQSAGHEGMGHGGMMMGPESGEHRAFHEEMEQLRKEHEELDAAREKLMDKCMNAPKAEAASCKEERKALHEKAEKLHERMKAMHEKMEAMHKEHFEHRKEMMEQHENKAAPTGEEKPAAPEAPPAAQ